MSLRKKALGGLAWTFAQQLSGQGIHFLVSIILARVLLPEEFGLIGMLAIFVTIGNSLMDSGMTSSLIRTPDADQRDFSTVFFMNLVGSVVIYLILYLCAPLIADFFRQPVLTTVVRVYFLSFIIRAFSMVQHTRLTKIMDFKTQMTISIPSLIIAGLLGIAMAYNGFGVWSLVGMELTQAALSSIQLWIRSGWAPSFIFDRVRFKGHFNFGYKMTLSGLLNTIYTNIYNVIIGKYFSAGQLGFYTMAQAMRQVPVSNIAAVLNKVTYPLFAGIQDDTVRLKSVYKRLMQQVLFWIAPALVIAAVLAEPLFRFVLTEKWLPAVPYFQILCFVGIMYPLHSYNLNVLKVKGRSDLFLKLEVIKKILITVVILVVVSFGIYGLLWGQVFISIVGFFINTHYSGRLINYKVQEQLRDILPIFGIAGLCGASCYLFNYAIGNALPDWGTVLVAGALSMAVYLGLAYIAKLSALHDFKTLILKR